MSHHETDYPWRDGFPVRTAAGYLRCRHGLSAVDDIHQRFSAAYDSVRHSRFSGGLITVIDGIRTGICCSR